MFRIALLGLALSTSLSAITLIGEYLQLSYNVQNIIPSVITP